jgi:hypothetical protein
MGERAAKIVRSARHWIDDGTIAVGSMSHMDQQQKSEQLQKADHRTVMLGTVRIKPGTQMIRQWQDTTHTVTALAEGFEWNGRNYKSLSAVANAITGTNWNGFAFFGVKRAPSSNKNAAGPRRNKLDAVPDAEAAPVSPLKTNVGNRRA